jgi:hypothetical protein
MSEVKLSGRCYCAAVTFEIDGESDWVGHCHCQSCRRASGSVMTTFAGFRPEQVRFTGAMPKRYTTDDGVTRSFCAQCGSPVSFEIDSRSDEIHLHLGLFDDLEQLAPTNHSFIEEKPSWLHADEHLPNVDWSPEGRD